MTHADGMAKLLRFAGIYGPGRTLYKAAGRLRFRVPSWSFGHRSPDIGVIGCGQFAFATLGYFLSRVSGHRIGACFDIEASARESLGRALGVPRIVASAEELLAVPELRTVYIASNHASHAPYAVQALARGLDVYVEKPIAVDSGQLVALLKQQRLTGGRLYAGYNRPFSAAIRDLRRLMPVDAQAGVSMQCFVAGHKLAPDHWYRRPDEGTRICGNLGHWLDLLVHVLSWRGLPDRLKIQIACADPAEPDDNLGVSITSDRGDLFSVMLTSRNEPFEGISESIHVQHGETTGRIDDFRRMTLWQGPHRWRRRYWPKDVGHRAAILQPFGSLARDWHEVELSTLLMLHIAAMVRAGERESAFSFIEAWRALCAQVEQA